MNSQFDMVLEDQKTASIVDYYPIKQLCFRKLKKKSINCKEFLSQSNKVYFELNNCSLKKDLLDRVMTDNRNVSEKGASNWLTAVPFKRYCYVFTLTKSDFRDGHCIEYNIEAKKTPINCSCAENFTLSHALHGTKVRYIHIRHSEIKTPLFTSCMTLL